MERIEIIDAVGREYCTSNIENGEFSYPKAFKEKNLDFEPIKKRAAKVLGSSFIFVLSRTGFLCLSKQRTMLISGRQLKNR